MTGEIFQEGGHIHSREVEIFRTRHRFQLEQSRIGAAFIDCQRHVYLIETLLVFIHFFIESSERRVLGEEFLADSQLNR